MALANSSWAPGPFPTHGPEGALYLAQLARMAAEEDVEAAGLECELLGKWGSFGWWLQVFLGAVCMASLIGKRFTDKVRRSWKVWFFDTAKQGTQALMNHIINIGLSMGFGEWLEVEADPCNWYWINMSLDCTLGVAIMFLLLRTLQCVYRSKCVARPELARCGHYGDPPDFKNFLRQLLDWQALVIVQKLLLAALVINFRAGLASFASALLGWLDSFPRAKLVVVMVLMPVVLNVFALWTADSFLQANSSDGEELQVRESLVVGAIVGRDGPILQVDEEMDDTIMSFREWKRNGRPA